MKPHTIIMDYSYRYFVYVIYPLGWYVKCYSEMEYCHSCYWRINTYLNQNKENFQVVLREMHALLNKYCLMYLSTQLKFAFDVFTHS